MAKFIEIQYVYIVIAILMTCKTIESDVHTSIGELIDVFRMEQELVRKCLIV